MGTSHQHKKIRFTIRVIATSTLKRTVNEIAKKFKVELKSFEREKRQKAGPIKLVSTKLIKPHYLELTYESKR